MKKPEKQHNAPPCPASRLNPTMSIAKHFHAIGIPCKGGGSTNQHAKAVKKAARQAQAKATANPPYSRQEAKARTAEALAQHRAETGWKAPLAKKERRCRAMTPLEIIRDQLPIATPEFCRRNADVYEKRVQTLRKNSAHVLLSDKRGSAKECWMPKPKGM